MVRSTPAVGTIASGLVTGADAQFYTAIGLIGGAILLGFVYSVVELISLKNIKLDGKGAVGSEKPLALMTKVADAISEGASAFLFEEFKYLSVYILVVSLGIMALFQWQWQTAFAFLIGSLTSCVCAYIGMRTAVTCNVRTTHACWVDSLGHGFDVAVRGGSVMGLLLVSFSLAAMMSVIAVLAYGKTGADATHVYECVAGFGLGASSIALFARISGGIYTKAADVGADLAGKNEYGMDEDDPRNPACIADNVGDNVGDIAGMGADLFGSLAESSCAAFLLMSHALATANLSDQYPVFGVIYLFPVILSAVGVMVSFVTLIAVRVLFTVNSFERVEMALKLFLIVSTGGMLGAAALVSYFFWPTDGLVMGATGVVAVTLWYHVFMCIGTGLLAGLFIGLVTEYFTSHSYTPVREIAETQKVSAATGIIFGLSAGFYSCIIPGVLIGVTVVISHYFAGLYGLAMAAIGMLSTLCVGMAIDAYGPISDNAGGIAEMAGLGPEVRERTDALDAAGNTTAAIGKGFAIGSAALVSLALFGAFCRRANVLSVDLLQTNVFAGLLLGGICAFAFSAMTMKSVGVAAQEMVEEVLQQIPQILSGKMEPNYARCVAISTASSVREMILPGMLVLLAPVFAKLLLGNEGTAGLLIGGLVSGVLLAISMANQGGAWDNAKKYIESGALGDGHKKGSATHKNAVIGDTVGDPLKDTSGPALNILVKLSAITALIVVNEVPTLWK